MLELWAETFCAATMCFGAVPDPTASDRYHEEQHPSLSKQKCATDVTDDESCFVPSEQSKTLEYSSAREPAETRTVVSPVAPSTPVRGSVSEDAEVPTAPIKKRGPPSVSRPPSHFRQARWHSVPSSPSLIIKKANPLVMKDYYYEKDDDEDTVSTQSTQSSYSMSSTSPRLLEAAGSTVEEMPLEWRKGYSSMELNWNDAVVEDTTEGFRIHGPPTLVSVPVVQKEEDWVFETPTRPESSRRVQLPPSLTAHFT